MLGKNPIQSHWQTELQVFYQNLSLLQQQMEAGAIHDLRVAIKKLRSYYKLCNALYDKKNTERSFLKTKELFSALGRHRNIEMSRQLLLSFAGKNKETLNFLFLHLQLLQDEVSTYCETVLQHYEEQELKDLADELEKDFENFSQEEALLKVKDLLTSCLQTVKHDLRHFKEKSHLVRKTLKNVFYWAKIFENDSILTKRQIKEIDKILDHLGNVQDHEVLLTNLKNFRKTILSKGMTEYDQVKKLESKAEKKKESLLDRADKMTHNLVREL